jgi:ferrous iron transport protein B
MTCSARLPVYILIIAAFIPNRPLLGDLLGMRAAVMLSLYVLGFLAAFGTAWLLKSSILRTASAPFILELPQYRMPTVRSVGLRVVDRGKVFLKQTGTIILCVMVVLWVLSHVPFNASLPQSIIGHIGMWIEPVIRPLGFNWKIGIGLLSSVVAREVIVGTLGTLYGADPATQSLSLQTALRHDLTLGGAMALVVFFAFAMQCTSTLAVVKRETNSWKWPAIQFAYMSVLAYLAALATNQIILHLF